MNPCYTAKRTLLFLLVFTLIFSSISLASQEAKQPQHGESGLSKHPWQFGLFVQGGFPPEYKMRTDYFSVDEIHGDIKLQLYSAGFEVGKQTRRFEGPMPLRGRGEAMLEVMPFWLARYPAQSIVLIDNSSRKLITYHWNSQDFHGASITPFSLRWNFSQRDSVRFVPWVQIGGGLLWTNHKFPINFLPGTIFFENNTNVINFTPQVGAGINIFNKPKRSVNFAVKAVHYSNAGLGAYNPGVKFTLQLSAGYSWWK